MRVRIFYTFYMSKTTKNKGFTLIELLVVVLIIGILAAVAVPQYRRTVEKSYSAEAFVNLKALTNAEKMYILATGAPTSNLDDLDVQITGTKIAANTIQTKTFTYDIRNLNTQSPGSFEIVATRNSSAQDKKYYLYRQWGDFFVCTAQNQESMANCSVFCTPGAWDSSRSRSDCNVR
jgi:prepilin-type N-terminal cleavage/methylation domain-containing protein